MNIVFEFTAENGAFQADHTGQSGQDAALIETFTQRFRELSDSDPHEITRPLHDHLGNVIGQTTAEA